MTETADLLTLALLPDLGARRVRELADRAPLHDVIVRPDEHADLISPLALARLKSGEARRAADTELARAAQLHIRIVGRDEPAYPGYLRQIYDPPPVLYVRGRLVADEGPRSLAVVGSRAASPEGRTLTRALARQLAAAGVTIVSGLARGIDTEAHRGALDAGGRTVAVLGSGLDRVYPSENEEVLEAVIERGAAVSELPLGTAPLPHHFPRRNRVIAGWSRAVVVVEAAEKSGALGTVRCALDAGRDVFAVPGHPSHRGAAGTNRLIREGAVLVRDAGDIAQELGIVMHRTSPAEGEDDDVLKLLHRDAPSSVEELQRRSGRPVHELLARLAELELVDRIRRLPGSLYVRN